MIGELCSNSQVLPIGVYNQAELRTLSQQIQASLTEADVQSFKNLIELWGLMKSVESAIRFIHSHLLSLIC